MAGYLIDKDKGKCYGCEACVQICPKSALKMEEDDEGFRYPILNKMKKYVLKALAAVHFQLLSILFAMTIM